MGPNGPQWAPMGPLGLRLACAWLALAFAFAQAASSFHEELINCIARVVSVLLAFIAPQLRGTYFCGTENSGLFCRPLLVKPQSR